VKNLSSLCVFSADGRAIVEGLQGFECGAFYSHAFGVWGALKWWEEGKSLSSCEKKGRRGAAEGGSGAIGDEQFKHP
jgi:hypothetical protein